MAFNLDRCEVLHFGKSNQGRTFTVNSRSLRNVVVERDLVQVDIYLKRCIQLKRVQRGFMGMLPGLEGPSYREWLDRRGS